MTTKHHFIEQIPTRMACFNVLSTGNLLNSLTLCRSRTCAKERKHAFQNKTKVDSQVFNTDHHKRSRFHALLKYFGLKEWKCVFLANHICENISHYIPRMGNGHMCEQDGHYHEIYPELGVGDNAWGGPWRGDLVHFNQLYVMKIIQNSFYLFTVSEYTKIHVNINPSSAIENNLLLVN